MKILYSCLSRSWGGMEMYTLTCVHQLIARGHEVHLLAYPGSKLFDEAKEQQLSVYPVKASGYFHPAEILALKNLIQKNRYDLVHTQASKDLWILVPALRISRSRIPLYLTKQVGSFIVKKDALHKWIYNRVTRVFAISRVIENNLEETTPVSTERISLLHNAIDTNHFDPAKADRTLLRNEFKIADDEILIGMLARFSKGKGHEEMIHAAGILNKKHSSVKYLIVGEASKGEDDYAEGIKKLAREADLGNMIFTGFRKDVRTVLAALDIFVFPSHNEAFGIALAEALSMGVASVCSNKDGILDIAVDGQTSLLFQVKDGDDLAEKISRLIEDAEMRGRLGRNSRQRAIKHFDLQVLTDRVIDFYKKDIRI
ncbi:MAG: hypothetical protein AMXMBFR48_29200 [Ignavibacteriales bacterium]